MKGEFEKRLLGLEGAVLDSDVSKVINDAYKEFPKWDEICREYKESNMPVNEIIEYANTRLSQKAQLWFKKWFGEKVEG